MSYNETALVQLIRYTTQKYISRANLKSYEAAYVDFCHVTNCVTSLSSFLLSRDQSKRTRKHTDSRNRNETHYVRKRVVLSGDSPESSIRCIERRVDCDNQRFEDATTAPPVVAKAVTKWNRARIAWHVTEFVPRVITHKLSGRVTRVCTLTVIVQRSSRGEIYYGVSYYTAAWSRS